MDLLRKKGRHSLAQRRPSDPLEEMQEVLNEYCKNVDVVIECVGKIKTQEQAVQFAEKRLQLCCLIGCSGRKFPICPGRLFKKELKVMSSYINPYTFEEQCRYWRLKR